MERCPSPSLHADHDIGKGCGILDDQWEQEDSNFVNFFFFFFTD